MTDSANISNVLTLASPPTLRGHDVTSIDVAAIIDNDLGPMLCGYDLDLSTKKAVPHCDNIDPKSGLPVFSNTTPLKDGLFVVLADAIYAYVGSQIGTAKEKEESQREFLRQCEKIIATFGDADTPSHTAKLAVHKIKQAADRHVATVLGRNP